FKKRKIRYIHRAVLIIEILMLAVTAFLPQQEVTNVICNIIVSFVCAMQMEAFKQFAGQNFTTTVSTGNLRKFIGFSYKAILNRDHESFKIALIYLLIVFTFILGAYSGYLLSQRLSEKAVLIPVALMFICLIIITYKRIYPETKRA
ncbi:MAG: YoaK family protein, partial [bacterium]